MNQQRFTVLSIEDNMPDFDILKQALKSIVSLNIEVINVQNGKDAIKFIYKEDPYKSAPTPDLIILDINLPLLSGQEILKILKNNDHYKVIPIIMFSTSDSQTDIKQSYNLHANSYITKTFDLKKMFNKIATLGEYWLRTNELPETDNYCHIK